jgi:hypothetical protein
MPTIQQPFTLWTKPDRIVGEIVHTKNAGHACLYSDEVIFRCYRPIIREASSIGIRWRRLDSISHYEMERRAN